MITDDAQLLVERFGIHFGKAQSVPVHPHVTIPSFYMYPSLLVENPFVPCLFFWQHGDFVQTPVVFSLIFEGEEAPLKVEKQANAFGIVLVDIVLKHRMERLVSILVHSHLSQDAHIIFATKRFDKDEAVQTMRREIRRVKYLKPKTDRLCEIEYNLGLDDDDDGLVSTTYKSLNDGITLQHFADTTNVIVYTCCGTLFTLDYVFESHAINCLRKLRYPCQCPECGAIAFDPIGNIRRFTKEFRESMRNKSLYCIQDGKLQFT